MSRNYLLYVNDNAGADLSLRGLKLYDADDNLVSTSAPFDFANNTGGQPLSWASNMFLQMAGLAVAISFSTIDNTDIYKIGMMSDIDYTNVGFSLREYVNGASTPSALNQITIPSMNAGVETMIQIKVNHHFRLPTEIDKSRLPKLKASVLAGEHYGILDVAALLVGKTLPAQKALNALIDGKTFAEVCTLSGLSKSTALKVMALYNVTVDADRMRVDSIINRIKTEYALLVQFNDFLGNNGISPVNPNQFLKLYSDAQINSQLLPFCQAYGY